MANARTFGDAMHTSLPGAPLPDLSLNCCALDGSAPGHERMAGRMAPQPLGPATRALWAKTRRRLDKDTNPDDENARHSIQPISGKESTAKEELYQLESCFIQELNVKILWQDSRMLASHIRSTVFFVSPRIQFLFVNLDHQNGERSVDVLHRFGNLWLQSYKKISLNMTWKVCTLFQSLVLVPKYSHGIGVPVFKLAPVGHEHLFSIISPGVSVLGMLDILQQIVSEASAAAENCMSDV